jgi:hypothetical protein
MRFEKRYNILSEFDFRLLEDPDFKEDSVREEMIVPILKALGYGPERPNKIIRSKKLLHPFVSIGSVTQNIYITPDYILEVNGRFAWTFEAKAPAEKLMNSKHIEQAYSYAIHSEIRVPYFALCNGREFVLYHVSKPQPVLQFDMRILPNYWDNVVKLLGPKTVLDYDFKLAKDFGLHLKRLGFHNVSSLIFADVPIAYIAKYSEEHYTFSTGIRPNEADSYVVTFDFGSKVMQQLHGKIPTNAWEILKKPATNAIQQVVFADAIFRVTVDCRVGEKLEENEDEIFLPLWINAIRS